MTGRMRNLPALHGSGEAPRSAGEHRRPRPVRPTRPDPCGLWRIVVCGLLLFAAAAAAQQPPDSAHRAATSRQDNLRTLRAAVATRDAVLLSPQLRSASEIRTDAPADAPIAASPAEVPAAAPAVGDIAGTAGVSPAIAAETIFAPASAQAESGLSKGQLSTVQLRPSEETMARQQVVELLRPSLPASTASLVTFPDLVRQLDQQSREVNLKPYVFVGKVMTYRPDTDRFVGELRVGVVDVLDKLTPRALSRPLWFEVAESDIAEPPHLQVDTAGARPLSFAISERRPSVPYVVRVSSSFDQEGIDVRLKVKPTLFIESERGTLQGLGLEKTMLHVIGYGLEKPEGMTVTLTSPTSPHFDASELHLDKEGRASTSLRSDWPGKVSLRATAPGFDSVPITIAFLWPLQTLAFSVFGGLLGGLIRLLPKAGDGTNRRWWLALLVSIGIGLLVFVLAVVGVKVLPVDFAVSVGYVFVFAISALGAWLGTRALAPLARSGKR